MAEKVGQIYYDVSLETQGLIDGQRKVDKELQKTGASLDGLSTKLTAAAAAVAVLAAAYAALKIAKLADEFRLLGARVEVAAGSLESGSSAFSDLVKISRDTQSSLAGNIEVFTRLNQSILQMGGTQRDTLIVTELLAKAIKVSGASAVEAKAAMLQFGQALGSGKLAGDELRSLMETAPYLMRQLADGIGVPVGALKKLGEEGKLTADVITNALTQAAAKIDADFKKFPQTIESAMVVAQDAAALAALKFDELTGSSAALTGVVKGVGEVLGKLADQFGAANDQAGVLGRNTAVKGWADTSREALSYLVDAADVVWQTLSVLGRNVAFVFTGIGKEIGGIGAQATAVLRGDFAGAKAIGEAMVADSEQRRKALDAADAKTLGRAKLAGQAMREAWEQGAGGGRGFVNPTPAASKLKAPASEKKPKKAKAEKFDDDAYLSALRRAQATEIGVINETEAEALRRNKKLLEEKKINEQTYSEAVKLITLTAEEDRVALMAKTQVDIDKGRLQAERETQAELDKIKNNREAAKGTIAAVNPIEALRFEEQQKLAVLEEHRLIDIANTQLYEDAKLAVHQATAEKIRQVNDQNAAKDQALQSQQLQGYASLFGGVADLTKNFAGKQSGAYKAMFAVSKAFAIADAIIKIQQGIAGAAALPFPANLPAIGAVVAATSGIISTISGANFGGARQYGGPVTAGSLYRVNEQGPEMFVGSNGSQYMLPSKSGSITPNDQLGGNVQWSVNVYNAPPGTTATVDQTARTVEIAVAQVASQIQNNEGKVWSALRGSTNVRTSGL